MKTIPYEKFKHGQRVTCEIDGETIKDAKISVGENGMIYLCSNIKNGDNDADNLLGYKYSYSFLTKNQNFEDTDYRTLKNLQFPPRTLDDLEEGDVLVDCLGSEKVVLGKCGKVFALSSKAYETSIGSWETIQDIQNLGYTIKQEGLDELFRTSTEEEKKILDNPLLKITADEQTIIYKGKTYILSK